MTFTWVICAGLYLVALVLAVKAIRARTWPFRGQPVGWISGLAALAAGSGTWLHLSERYPLAWLQLVALMLAGVALLAAARPAAAGRSLRWIALAVPVAAVAVTSGVALLGPGVTIAGDPVPASWLVGYALGVAVVCFTLPALVTARLLRWVGGPPTAPSGWYPDPETPGRPGIRYWDGTTWTDEIRPSRPTHG